MRRRKVTDLLAENDGREVQQIETGLHGLGWQITTCTPFLFCLAYHTSRFEVSTLARMTAVPIHSSLKIL
jgi:hypothetical protein